MNQMAHSTFGAHTETTSVHAAYGFRVQETRIALMNYSDISVEKKIFESDCRTSAELDERNEMNRKLTNCCLRTHTMLNVTRYFIYVHY